MQHSYYGHCRSVPEAISTNNPTSSDAVDARDGLVSHMPGPTVPQVAPHAAAAMPATVPQVAPPAAGSSGDTAASSDAARGGLVQLSSEQAKNMRERTSRKKAHLMLQELRRTLNPNEGHYSMDLTDGSRFP